MASYFNACDVTVYNSKHKIFLKFLTWTCASPLWKRFRHPCSQRPYLRHWGI